MTGSLKKSKQIAHVSSFLRSSPAAPAVAMFTSQQQYNTEGRGGKAAGTFVLRHFPFKPIRFLPRSASIHLINQLKKGKVSILRPMSDEGSRL